MSRDMRLDSDNSTSSPNGIRNHLNGSSLPPLHKSNPVATSNGYSHATNGDSGAYTNGSTPVTAKSKSPTYFGHDREEVTRLLIQSLNDLGYNESANRLVQESGYEFESPSVAAFRHAILDGEWTEAEALLFGTHRPEEGGGVSIHNGAADQHEGLLLAEGVDQNELRFRLRRQKYLELLEGRDHGGALMVLRQELTPLHQDVGQLHVLSGLMVCQSADDLRSQASWDGAKGASRNMLLLELSKAISPSVMIPDHRLANLLDQVKLSQISSCLYHNPTASPSLFSDHYCDRSQFPLQTQRVLDQKDQVWYLEFSHDGRKLATCGNENAVTVYDTTKFPVHFILSEHTKSVPYLAWSPDDTMLITCSKDATAKLWDISTGRCLLSINLGEQPVTSAAWAPDGQSFVTGSLDQQASLHVWKLNGENIHTWSGGNRVADLALSPDGQRLVVLSPPRDKQLTVYNFITWEEEYKLDFQTELTCVTISRDSKYMLLNLVANEIQLIDITTAELVRIYRGQKQGEYVIRSTFGGADDNLVISGSEDGHVYIWHKENTHLIKRLEGHSGGCVNSIAWNPADPCMFASAGDDKTVRIWSKETTSPSRTRRSSIGAYRFHSARSFVDSSGAVL